jgi:excisionase family DNA binding protein
LSLRGDLRGTVLATAFADTNTAASFGLPDLMTAAQVAEVCQVRPETVQQWARDRMPLRGVKVGNEWRFRTEDVQRLLGVFGGGTEPVDIGPK